MSDLTANVLSAMHQHEPPAQRSESSRGIDQGMRVLSYLIAGVVLWGLLGWLGDRLLGTAFLLPVGIVGGAALGSDASV